MDSALYDAENGYYTRRIKTVGRGGDFSTSATLSPLLGRALVSVMQSMQPSGPLHLIEVGPGNGALAASVLKHLGWWKRRRAKLLLVEKSPVLRAVQQAALKSHGCVQWVDSVEQALDLLGGEAFIYSNELVDAFPVVLAEWREERWQEVWLEISAQGGLVETLRPLPEGISAVPLNKEWLRTEGQRVEIPWSFHEWLRGWTSHAKRVSMVTIDYGGEFPELYARRPSGSLRGYLRHERKQGTGVYENMGSQDITADVCFSDLMAWGEELGWKTLRHLSQGEFLKEFGNPKIGQREDDYLTRDDGAGGAFRVLVQQLTTGDT